jgi:hypothetical protein
MDLSDRINRLMDVERAGEQRCDRSAHLAAAGPVKALLLLQAAEHRSAAETLNDAIVRLRGTPQAGDADTVLRDPSGPGFPVGDPSDSVLLASCIDESIGAQAQYRQVLDERGLPDWLDSLLAGLLHASRTQCERLRQARHAVDPAASRAAADALADRLDGSTQAAAAAPDGPALRQALDQLPEGPNVAPSAREHLAARGGDVA